MALVPYVPNLIPDVSLGGLAAAWERDETVRRAVLINRRLLVWLSSEKTGVPSFPCAALNFEVLELFFRKWVSMAPRKRTPSQLVCKREALAMKQESAMSQTELN